MSAAAPITEAQLNANRQNAQSSTGPRTTEGRNRARLNGLRHGLTGQTVVMPHEDRAAYDSHLRSTLQSLNPQTAAERDLAEAIANDQWRLNRVRAIEENIFSLGAINNPVEFEDGDPLSNAALTQAQTFLNDSRQLGLLTLYESRINRGLQRNLAALRTLQSERKAAEAHALEEAALLLQLAVSEGRTYLPQPDGFAFSVAEITRHLDRQTRLADARQLFRTVKGGLKKAA